jgi:hypothetical protein
LYKVKLLTIKSRIEMKSIYVSVFIICLVGFSCKKTKEEEAIKPTFIGFWQGKFGVGDDTVPNQDVILNVLSNGVIKVYNGKDTTTAASKAVGKWTATNSQFSANYAYSTAPKDTYTLSLNEFFGFATMEGIWKSSANTAFGGRMIYKKR